jgi:hypothetical protein
MRKIDSAFGKEEKLKFIFLLEKNIDYTEKPRCHH